MVEGIGLPQLRGWLPSTERPRCEDDDIDVPGRLASALLSVQPSALESAMVSL